MPKPRATDCFVCVVGGEGANAHTPMMFLELFVASSRMSFCMCRSNSLKGAAEFRLRQNGRFYQCVDVYVLCACIVVNV